MSLEQRMPPQATMGGIYGVSRLTVAYPPFLMYLAILPTGNSNPALADRLCAFFENLFPLVVPFPFPAFPEPFLAGIFQFNASN